METKHLPAKTTAIEKVKERFETWREVRKKRTKIPGGIMRVMRG